MRRDTPSRRSGTHPVVALNFESFGIGMIPNKGSHCHAQADSQTSIVMDPEVLLEERQELRDSPGGSDSDEGDPTRASSSVGQVEVTGATWQVRVCTKRTLVVLATSVVLIVWVCSIGYLVYKEQWQLVLLSWLTLYAAAHFCYWYFKKHSILALQCHIRQSILDISRSPQATPPEKGSDEPPTYAEIMKAEPPPPDYYNVVNEAPSDTEIPSGKKDRSGLSEERSFKKRSLLKRVSFLRSPSHAPSRPVPVHAPPPPPQEGDSRSSSQT